MSPKKRTSKRTPANLVFCGNGCDTASAAIFIAEMRSASLPVKLVGLGGVQSKGSFGFSIVNDMTLGDAMKLANRAVYVIFTFVGNGISPFLNDPRLHQFVEEAHENGAIFIESEQVGKSSAMPKVFKSDTPFRILSYPSREELYDFIRELEWSE